MLESLDPQEKDDVLAGQLASGSVDLETIGITIETLLEGFHGVHFALGGRRRCRNGVFLCTNFLILKVSQDLISLLLGIVLLVNLIDWKEKCDAFYSDQARSEP